MFPSASETAKALLKSAPSDDHEPTAERRRRYVYIIGMQLSKHPMVNPMGGAYETEEKARAAILNTCTPWQCGDTMIIGYYTIPLGEWAPVTEHPTFTRVL
jgi:hypothetical protein